MSRKGSPSGEDILSWVRQGLAMMEAAGIVIPRELILRPRAAAIEREPTHEQRRIRDQVDRFLDASVDQLAGSPPLQAQKIYEAYRRFADKFKEEPASQTAFGRALARRLRKEKLGDKIYYLDVRLKDEPGLPL